MKLASIGRSGTGHGSAVKRAIFAAASHAQRAADFLHALQLKGHVNADAATLVPSSVAAQHQDTLADL